MKNGVYYLTFLFICFFASFSFSAEFQGKKPVRILELNEKTLLENVWPGMTIKQTIQILGEPEEVIKVKYSSGEPALRYGIYWIIPQEDGLQVQCIINQRGFKTYGDRVVRCHEIKKEYRLTIQK